MRSLTKNMETQHWRKDIRSRCVRWQRVCALVHTLEARPQFSLEHESVVSVYPPQNVPGIF